MTLSCLAAKKKKPIGCVCYTERGSSCSSPDGLVPQPAGVTVVQALQVGRLELPSAGHRGSDALTRQLGLQEGQGVTARDGPVVEHNAYGGHGFTMPARQMRSVLCIGLLLQLLLV